MDDEIEPLFVEVRIPTSDFERDLEIMRKGIDTTLIDGFAVAGKVLERGLMNAIQRGTLGFDDLKRVALQALGEIAANALRLGLDQLLGRTSPEGGGSFPGIPRFPTPFPFPFPFPGFPGRATGGPVAPQRPYWVGERGPELFVPTSAGRVEATGAVPREVRVSISVAPPRGSDAPTALRRSSRQVASSVRRALSGF